MSTKNSVDGSAQLTNSYKTLYLANIYFFQVQTSETLEKGIQQTNTYLIQNAVSYTSYTVMP